MGLIYFDNAATTKPCPEALDIFNQISDSCYGNPSSFHSLGIKSEKIIMAAKKTILSKFNADGDFIFTSGATESNNLAIRGFQNNSGNKGQKVITTSTEHPSVAKVLEQTPHEIIKLSPKDFSDIGFEQELINAVDENTSLISIIGVNNETGYIIDTKKVYDGVKRKFPNCHIHVDGVQAFLKMPIYGDTISISAHKIHCFKGIGGLFVKNGVKIKPITFGGGQQKGLRSGTEAVELIAAFGAAVENYNYKSEHFRKLHSCLLQLLCSENSINDITINSYNNIPGIINFSVKGIKSEILLHFLAEKNIFISSGSACARGKKSAVLAGFGVKSEDIDSAVRISFSKYNTTEEIEIFIKTLMEAKKRLKQKRKR